VRDLRERTSELIHRAETGKLSVITRHGTPVFIAVPFDDTLLQEDVGVALAMRLFDAELISLSRAARMARRTVGEMIDLLGSHGIPVIRSTERALEQELADFA
jgi:prevent-host-death family protein